MVPALDIEEAHDFLGRLQEEEQEGDLDRQPTDPREEIPERHELGATVIVIGDFRGE